MLGVQQALLWAVLRGHNPETTVTFDCVSGAMGYEALRGWSFSPFDSYDGVLGGMFVASLVGLPLFAVFGVTGLSVKLVSALLSALLTIATWWLWSRHRSMLDGVLAAAAVVLVPPLVFISSLMMGHWHFTELLFETLCVLFLYHLVFTRPADTAPSGALLAGFGLLLGLALFNCFASVVFFPAFLLFLWAALKERLRPGHGLLLGAGLLVASSPLWWKLFVHVPYGVEQSIRPGIPPQVTHSRFHWDEIRDMFAGGGFSGAMHFDTAFGGNPPNSVLLGLAALVTAGLFLGWLLMMVRVAPSVRLLLVALLPGRPALDRSRISAAAMPPVMAGLYGLAYILSGLHLRRLPWWLSNPRDHAHLALVPWVVLMAVCGALLVASLVRESRSGAAPAGELPLPGWLSSKEAIVVSAALVLAVQLPSAVGIAAMVQSPLPGVAVGDTYRGHCWDVFGFYMAPYLSHDIGRVSESCDRFGEVGRVECYRGGAWALGFFSTSRALLAGEHGDSGPLGVDRAGGSAAVCLSLPVPWRQECLRGVGWALRTGGTGDVSDVKVRSADCDILVEEEDRRACWWGVGFPLGDHLASTPARLRQSLRNIPAKRQQWMVEGAGAQVGRTYGSLSVMEAICSSWGEEYKDSCLEGVNNSLSFRSNPGP